MSGDYAEQTVAILNSTGVRLRSVQIECGFFRGVDLLAAGFGFGENIEPGQTAYISVIANHASDATNAQCRVVGAR
jgi:hypothetical protein